jgi:adenylate kinase family enzyme
MKKLMENWRRFISEDVSGSPKVIFMAGGPGSGKSTAIKNLGLESITVINVDDFYEPALEKAGLGKNITKIKDDFSAARNKLIELTFQALNQEIPDEKIKHEQMEEYYAQAQETTPSPELEQAKKEYDRTRDTIVQQAKIFNAARAEAKQKRLDMADQGENFIVDGTGGVFGQIRNQKKELEDKGYKAGMVFVDVPLEVALDRQEQRLQAGGRSLPAKSVERSWNAVTKNKDKYSELFGDTFFLVKSGDEEFDFESVKGRVNNFMNSVSEYFKKELKPRLKKQMIRLLRHGGNKKSGPFKKKAPIDYRGSAPPGASGG